MNLAIVLHWLAYFAVVACAVSLVVYVCRELAARWRVRNLHRRNWDRFCSEQCRIKHKQWRTSK